MAGLSLAVRRHLMEKTANKSGGIGQTRWLHGRYSQLVERRACAAA
jgi:hypothetical protein